MQPIFRICGITRRMNSIITIETNEPEVSTSLGIVSGNPGERLALNEPFEVELLSHRVFRSADMGMLISFGVSFGSGVVSSVVASWVYDKLRGKPVILRIDGVVVEANEEQIAEALARTNSQPPTARTETDVNQS